MADNEAYLIIKAQQGDRLAFGELVLQHQTFVYNLALRACGNQQEAQDLAQETFIKAWLALPRFRMESRFRTWLYRIVINLCYNRNPYLKRDLEMATIDDQMEVPANLSTIDPLASLETSQLRRELHQKVLELPPAYRMMIQLRYQQELTYEEIASIMDIPLGTVKTGLYRAHAQLREFLSVPDEEEIWTN